MEPFNEEAQLDPILGFHVFVVQIQPDQPSTWLMETLVDIGQPPVNAKDADELLHGYGNDKEGLARRYSLHDKSAHDVTRRRNVDDHVNKETIFGK